MDLSRSLYVAFIEEDDEQRALFHVRPLLSEAGLVTGEELEGLGDEGFLRIVPDKSEQYTFKDRMRGLQPLCLIDTRPFGPELHKQRPNKNYGTTDETHQQVLYSDCVVALDQLELYEVVSDRLLFPPSTPGYYLRKGGHISGPYNSEDGEPLDALSCIAPDSDRLYAVSLPTGRDRLFYWPIGVGEQAGLESSAWGTAPAQRLLPGQGGEIAALRQAVDGLAQLLHQSGFACLRQQAAGTLLAAMINPGLMIECRHLADANLAAGLLRQVLPTARPTARDTHTALPTLLPSMRLKARPGFDLLLEEPAVQALQEDAALRALQALDEPVPDAALARLEQADAALQALGGSLSLQWKRDLLRFMRCAPGLLEDEMKALDVAFCLWLVPAWRAQSLDRAPLARLCTDLPLAAAESAP